MSNQPIDTNPEAKLSVKEKEVTTEQEFTADWAAYGTKESVEGYKNVELWLKITGSDSQDMRIRLRSYFDKEDTDIYRKQILTVTSTAVNAAPEYVELDDDGPQNVIIPYPLNLTGRYIQLEIMAGTVGASPCSLVNLKYIKG